MMPHKHTSLTLLASSPTPLPPILPSGSGGWWGGRGRLYITDQASIHLSCSWVAAGGDEGKRKDEKDGKRRRGWMWRGRKDDREEWGQRRGGVGQKRGGCKDEGENRLTMWKWRKQEERKEERTRRRHQDLPHGDIIFKKHESSTLELKKKKNYSS